MNSEATRWLAAAVVIVALALLGTGVIMAIAMTDMMDGHMGRGRNVAQTPAVLAGREVAIEIRDYDYFPREATIEAGTQVTWTNYDGAPHTATDLGEAWDTGLLERNESAVLTFDDAGTYEYYCTVHPYMKATLTVR